VLQTLTRLMGFKSKYSFSNQSYNGIIKFIVGLILSKHNMPKGVYQCKKIVSGLRLDYEKIDACEKIACCIGRSTRMTPNVCPAIGLDT
jgi:hypothetical protein